MFREETYICSENITLVLKKNINEQGTRKRHVSTTSQKTTERTQNRSFAVKPLEAHSVYKQPTCFPSSSYWHQNNVIAFKTIASSIIMCCECCLDSMSAVNGRNTFEDFSAPGKLSMSVENTVESYDAGKVEARLERISSATTAASEVPVRPSLFLANIEVVSSKAVCNSTVSVWKERARNRLVQIVGTFHISKSSADLARQLVRDVHPNAVFIEIDRDRMDALTQDIRQYQELEDSNNPPKPMSFLVPALTPIVAEQETAPWWRPRGMFQRLLLFAYTWCVRVVINIYGSMNEDFENQGFSPGEEFAAAAVEAQKQGADVFLGDQDYTYTMACLKTSFVDGYP